MGINKSRIYLMSDEDFIKLVKNSVGYSDCLRAFGLSPKGGSSVDIIKRRIKELNIDTSHFSKSAVCSKNRREYSSKDIFKKNSTYSNMTKLKKRLILEYNVEYKCALCGLSTWRDKPISLQLDHINGDNTDHRISNLRLLCPNCHSQTTTYYLCRQKHKGVWCQRLA